jgi:uncharacterized paraquat-inducible protein A
MVLHSRADSATSFQCLALASLTGWNCLEMTMSEQETQIRCPHCDWNYSPTAKTCPRCGLKEKLPARVHKPKPQIASLGILMLLAAFSGPLLLELPLGYIFGVGVGASGFMLTLFGVSR